MQVFLFEMVKSKSEYKKHILHYLFYTFKVGKFKVKD